MSPKHYVHEKIHKIISAIEFFMYIFSESKQLIIMLIFFLVEKFLCGIVQLSGLQMNATNTHSTIMISVRMQHVHCSYSYVLRTNINSAHHVAKCVDAFIKTYNNLYYFRQLEWKNQKRNILSSIRRKKDWMEKVPNWIHCKF